MEDPKPDAQSQPVPSAPGDHASPSPQNDAGPPAAASPAGISAGEYLRAPASERLDITPTAVAREDALRRSLHGPEAAEDTFSDLRQARQRRARLRRMAGWLSLPLLVAAAGTAWWQRAELAGRFPALRPAFQAVCRPLGCRVPPWRNLDALRIDSSQLERPGQGDDAYRLSLILRNGSRAAVALPDLELTLSGDDDRAVATHRFAPVDYLPPEQRAALDEGLTPGGELPLQVRFETRTGTQADTQAGRQARTPVRSPTDEPRRETDTSAGAVNYRLRILYP